MRLIWVGKTKNEHLRALVDEYVKRIERFARCEIVHVREGTRGANEREVLASEERHLLGAVGADARMVLLDVEGRSWSSHDLAKYVEEWQVRGAKDLAFVVGGHYGVSEAVRQRANQSWSLSRLTLTHEMARVVVVEQLYRAFTIIRGLPYQK
ncbi:MAG: 23S rRNA (pseudouridine(1915)-N(3))-methyltransferase RlmH [Pyrinomonadaceae bacterium]